MIHSCKYLFCAVIVLGFAATVAPVCAADDPIHAEDMIGNWKNTEGKTITVGMKGAELTLITKYPDWKPGSYLERSGKLQFERVLTEDDVRHMKLDKAQDPPSEQIISHAAGQVSEIFQGDAVRGSYAYGYLGDRCKLTMKVGWTGFHIKFDQSSWKQDGWPMTHDSYTQIRYWLPELSSVDVTITLDDPANVVDPQNMPSTRAEISSYFSDSATKKIFAEFTLALFKPFFGALGDAVEAETFVGKLGVELTKTVIENGVRGNLSTKQLMKTVTGQVLDKILGAAAGREPIGSIKAKLDKYLGEEQVSAVADKVNDAAADNISDKLTKENQVALSEFLKNQCRYEIRQLPPAGKVAGGVVLVDKLLGTAEFWLLLNGQGPRPAMTVHGTMGSLPEDGQKALKLSAQFTPLQQNKAD